MTTELKAYLPNRTFKKGDGQAVRKMVSVPEDVHADIHSLAESLGTSMSATVVALLDRYLDEQEKKAKK